MTKLQELLTKLNEEAEEHVPGWSSLVLGKDMKTLIEIIKVQAEALAASKADQYHFVDYSLEELNAMNEKVEALASAALEGK